MSVSKEKSEDIDYTANGHDHAANMMPTLEQVQTQGSITITPEMFERMYLAPQNKVSGDLRRTLGNPTPIGLGGFLIAYCPIIFSLLGWRGYTGNGAATVGTYYFSGGLLAIIAMILEFILGNTFPAVFFGVYGGYFLSYGATITPGFAAYLAYAPDPSDPSGGLEAPAFLSGLAFWNLMMGIFTIYCTICALRVNLLFTLAFFFLALTFILVAASYWCVTEAGKMVVGHNLQLAGASCGFVVMIIGWYLLLALMLTTVDFPFNLPVFDLSHVVPSNTELMKKRKNKKDLEKNN
ncbi:Protein alcS [Pseudocercospora fuligena]|uniref:Protein alcS n=1 Tax=Pseudocercospora fuligena TaxID=685502 RepID=A0A8H6VLC8_9PEZI|nr:Protein alcS [Pseudocercospora fuligena]